MTFEGRMMKHKVEILTLAVLLFLVPLPYLLHDTNHFYGDELVHYDQILRFINGEKVLNPHLTNLPAYHFLLALPGILVDRPKSVASIRFLSFAISVLSVLVVWITSNRVDKKTSIIKTLQYAFLPIMFPFFCLIYPDALSLSLVIIGFYFASNNEYRLSALAGILATLVRQNNIIWLFFLFVLLYAQSCKSFSIETLKQHLRKSWLFLLAFLAFVVFVLLNEGVAMGDRNMHPFALSLGNIYFLLFLSFLFFLPLHISNYNKILNIMDKRIILVMILIFILYMNTFSISHPYNQEEFSFSLRNKTLLFFTSSAPLKVLFFLPVAYSILSIAVTPLLSNAYYLLYPVTILSLLPSWLIEQRYYVIPFTLFTILRKAEHRDPETVLIVVNVACSFVLLYGVANLKFFL